MNLDADLSSFSLLELYGTEIAQRRMPPAATPKWQQQMEQIATLPRAKQQVVMQMLDSLLAGSAAA